MRDESANSGFWTFARQMLRAIGGVPDYEAHLAHCRQHHPERPLPSRAEFHREREAARYGRGRSRCC